LLPTRTDSLGQYNHYNHHWWFYSSAISLPFASIESRGQ
jgi:hypothetical protein